MENQLIFNSDDSQSIVDFLIKMGSNTIKLVKNPKTNKNFFVVEGTNVTGRVSKKITKLSAELRVTWVDVEGEPEKSSYMLHPQGEGGANTLDTFSVA
tara:strand:- start:119 stop:412 length:294 start_codon:yes stop_codon:yes gene_type:complete